MFDHAFLEVDELKGRFRFLIEIYKTIKGWVKGERDSEIEECGGYR